MKIKIHTPKYIYELGLRKNQEDYIWPEVGKATTNDRLFVVCDGMGGHEAGEVASQAVATAIGEWFEQNVAKDSVLTTADMEQAIAHAYRALDEKDPEQKSNMGTTLTAVVLHRGGCLVAHMGDSRIYHIDTRNRIIRYKSRDHSLVHDLWAMGEIFQHEMATHPRRNVITKAMLSGAGRRQEATIAHITHLTADDYLYLCSDGMLEQMDDNKILDFLCGPGSDDEKIEELIRATIGNSDNHSAYLIRIADVEREEGDDNLEDDEFVKSDPVGVEEVEMERIDEKERMENARDTSPSAGQPSPENRRRTIVWLLVLLLLVVAAIAGAIVKTLYFS